MLSRRVAPLVVRGTGIDGITIVKPGDGEEGIPGMTHEDLGDLAAAVSVVSRHSCSTGVTLWQDRRSEGEASSHTWMNRALLRRLGLV